jgi:hemerythrin
MTKTTHLDDDAHLGQDALDLEHQGQIDLLLAVEMELRGAAGKAQLHTLLDRLIEFSNIHFMSEQVLMREQAYPGLPAHEAEHDQLMDQMRDFQKRIESGERTLTAADLSTLRDWVLRHIRTKDTAFAQYLTANA